MNKIIKAILISAVALVMLNPLYALGTSIKKTDLKDNFGNTLESFFSRLDDLTYMRANFNQVLKSPDQSGVQRSTGQMWLSKPSYFKWYVTKPSEQILVSNGIKLWNYDVALEQVTVSEVPQDMSQAPYLLLLTGKRSTISSLFDITNINANAYRLTPKSSINSMIKYIDMNFSGKSLLSLAIYTETGQSTIITFSDLSFTKIPQSAYNFTPPKGVDVLGS